MDFSEAFRYTGPAPCYSPDGRYVACCQDQRVIIREVDQLQMVRVISCLDKVQRVSWCCNSNFILCRLPNRAQVWSLQNQDWSRKIDEGVAGVRQCIWSPDGSSVLVVADFQIRLTIYSMLSDAVKILRGPKAVDRGMAFSPNGEIFAYAERTDCKEYVSLISSSNWSLQSRVAVPTQDLADLAWAPDSRCFAVWDTLLTYKLLIYSSEGIRLATYSAYQDALGIRTVQWSPNGNLLAVGSHDQVARILAGKDWQPAAQLVHHTMWREEHKMVAYQEIDESTKAQPASGRSRSRYIVGEFPFRIQSTPQPLNKPNPKLGVGNMAWSADGAYLAVQNENMPHALFIWSAQTLELVSILLQIMPVRSFQWDPNDQRLVLCTGDTKLYLWSPNGASCVHIPVSGFCACTVAWASTGDALMLADRDSFCCAYIGFAAE